MKIKKVFSSYKKFVFGSDDSFDIQKKVFLLITHLTIIIGVAGIIVNIILGLGLFLTLFTVASVLFVAYFHYKARNYKLEVKYSLGLFLISLIIFPVLWFYNGGYNGNNIILIFVYFSAIITLLPRNFRFVAFITYSIMIVGLTIAHYYLPYLISSYENEYQRFVDLVLGYCLYLILAYSLQNIILSNYEIERERVIEQNDKLNDLVCQIKEAQNKLEESIKNVEELNSAKDRFITVLSHDLRSPFQGLLGVSKLLESDYYSFSDHEKRSYIGQISKSLEKQYNFLEELLYWGKIQKDALELNLESCSVKDLFDQVIEQLSELLHKKKIKIILNVQENISAVCDKDLMTTVLRNLVSNAIKFSPLGCNITLSAYNESDMVILSISDEGIGIPDDILPKLFKLNEKVSTTGTDGETGTGMGLILSNDIIKKHHGGITVTSKEGKGSTFKIMLPDIIL